MATQLAAVSQIGAADVYRAIGQVQKAISKTGIAKGRKNAQQGYSFRGIDDMYNSLSGLLAEADLCILPRMTDRKQEERPTQKGGLLFYVTVRGDFDFVSARDGSVHTVTMFGEAMDSADKATNKAMSAAWKYAVMQVFCIPTEGMADADATTPDPAPAARPRIVPPQPAVGVIEGLPEFEYEEIPEPESKLEHELADSIRMVNQRKNPASAPISGRPAWRIDMLRSFALMANRYRAIRMEHTYAAILALHGVHDMVEFPETPEGRDQALKCHRDMMADITRREQERRHA